MQARSDAPILETLEAAWLRGVFMRALSAAVVSTLGAAACGSDATVEGLCAEAVHIDLSAIKPAQPFDYAALRTTGYGADPSGLPDLWSAGVPCAGAADMEACQVALKEPLLMNDSRPAAAALGCGMIGCTYLVTTRGDEVEHYLTRDDVLKFLGPIDAAEDARLLLMGDYDTRCSGTRIESHGSGFRVTTLGHTGECPAMFWRAVVQVSAAGEVAELDREPLAPPSGPQPCPGRRPEGLAMTQHPGEMTSLGAYFAAMSELEAASVVAFEVLARELAYHHAPAPMIDAALAAARDEVRHAAVSADIARRYGAEPTLPIIRETALRSLEAIALDNATEGCVRETYGALLAHYQAAVARDAEIAAAMRVIAEDETRHAALSYQIDAWIMKRIDKAACARVNAAREQAILALTEATHARVSPALQQLAGAPDAAASTTLIANLSRELRWSVKCDMSAAAI